MSVYPFAHSFFLPFFIPPFPSETYKQRCAHTHSHTQFSASTKGKKAVGKATYMHANTPAPNGREDARTSEDTHAAMLQDMCDRSRGVSLVPLLS